MFTGAAGTVTQTVTDSFNASSTPGSVSYSYQSDFTGSSGTLITTKPGWAFDNTVAAGCTPRLDGNGNLIDGASNDNTNTWGLFQTPTGTRNGASLTMTFPTVTNGAIFFMAFASDHGNGFSGAITYDGTTLQMINAGIMQGGTSGSGGYNLNNGSSVAPGTVVTLVFAVSVDGNTLTVSSRIGGSTPFTQTFDMTGKTVGTKFGLLNRPYVDPLPGGAKISSFNYVDPASTLSVTDAPTYSFSNVATYTLAYTGTGLTGFQHSPDNGGHWYTGEYTNNSGTITYVATNPDGGQPTMQFRVLNDTPVVAVAGNSTKFLSQGQPMTLGFGLRGPNYYNFANFFADWGIGSDLGWDGTHANVAMPGIGIQAGNYTVTTNTGVNLSTMTATGLTVVSSNPSTGSHVVNISGDTTSRTLQNGTTQITKFSVSNPYATGEFDPQAINGWTGSWLRDLDLISDVNSCPITGTPTLNIDGQFPWTVRGAQGNPVPYQAIARFVAAVANAHPGFVGYWSVIAPYLTDAQITARATYQRDNIPSNVKIAIEFGNEWPWNAPTFTGAMRIAADALRNGYYGNATYNSPNASLNVIPAANGSISGNDGNTDGPACNTGDIVPYNYYGNAGQQGPQYFQATSNLSAGTTIAPGSNWTARTDLVFGTCSRMWGSVRHNQIIEIYRTVFGTRFASQIVPVRMGQLGDLTAQFTTEQNFVPGYWAKIVGVGVAPYYLGGNHISNFGSITTAAQVDAALRADIPNVQTSVLLAVQSCLAMGKLPMFYEQGADPGYLQYIDSKNNAQTTIPNFAPAVNAWQVSSYAQAFEHDTIAWLEAKVPGIVCHYDLVGGAPWSYMKSWADTSSQRLAGAQAALAGI